NNLMHHRHNSAGSFLSRLLHANYADGVYQALQEPRVPSARRLSDVVARGASGLPSQGNRTVLGVFFGFHILGEIVEADTAGCPAEFLNLAIPQGDPVFDPEGSGDVVLPFQRAQWAPGTGQSPNNPRVEVNGVTGWLDGSAIYGPSHSWSDSLRSFSQGMLRSGEDPGFPKQTKAGSLMWKVLDPSAQQGGPEGILEFGNAKGNANLFLQATGIVWFRYHNHWARELARQNPAWSDEDLFQHARKRVVAAYQNALSPLCHPLSRFCPAGYKQHVDARISPEFLVTSALFLVSHARANGSHSTALRLCNSYWNRENSNLKTAKDIDDLLLGMSSQIAEREDNIVVEDLRGMGCFGLAGPSWMWPPAPPAGPPWTRLLLRCERPECTCAPPWTHLAAPHLLLCCRSPFEGACFAL
uniref:Dual oxidase 1 n=1 Tax=Varanus komodoensis TaxID=61221 RepID=A0A8D2JBV1_VARKO